MSACFQCSLMSSCAASFWLNTFFCCFLCKMWPFGHTGSLMKILSLILPVLLMVLISFRKQTASRTYKYWLFSLCCCWIWVILVLQSCSYKANYKPSRLASDGPSDGYLALLQLLAPNLTMVCLQLATASLIWCLTKFFAVTFMEHMNNFLYRAWTSNSVIFFTLWNIKLYMFFLTYTRPYSAKRK